ncbi:MAG: DUF3667 domain-containing protein [Gemmatimonadales bacterium]
MSAEPTPSAMPERHSAVCLNCGAPLSGRYCSTCGQEDRALTPTLRDVAGDAWEAVTNLEGRILQSLGLLFFFPGFLTREYLEGRRVRWVSPARLYLVISVAYFGLVSLTGWSGNFDVELTGQTEAEIQAELAQRGFANEAELDRSAQEAVSTWIPRAMFLLVPFFAGLLAIARRPARRTYPQHLIFALHVHAAWFWAFALAAVASVVVNNDLADSVLSALSIAYALWYLVVALRTVYGGSLLSNLSSGVVIGVTYWMVTIGVTIAILLPIVLITGS